MKKSRIIALVTAFAMIMSAVPAFAQQSFPGDYVADENNVVYRYVGSSLIPNGDFENGKLEGITTNAEAYAVEHEDGGVQVSSGQYFLRALKSTKGEDAIKFTVPVTDPNASYMLSFSHINLDENLARRPRVTFAFTSDENSIPTEEDDFAVETNAWIGAGTASNPGGIEYSEGYWTYCERFINGNGDAAKCKYVVINIYGLTANSGLDDFKLYELKKEDALTNNFAAAIADYEKQCGKLPAGPICGEGVLALPTELVGGYKVNWDSTSRTIYDSDDGEDIGKYQSFPEQQLAVLTSRIYHPEISLLHVEYERAYIVESLFTPYIAWFNDSINDLGGVVSEDLELPLEMSLEGHQPVSFEWSTTDEKAIAPDGTFNEPDVTKDVDITATIIWHDNYTKVTRRVKALGGNIVDNGLVMYYDFEKPTGTSIPNSASDAKLKATSESVAFNNGYATLSGLGTIKLPSAYAKNLDSSYTVSMWVKLGSAIATSSGKYRFFDLGGGTKSSQFVRYVPSTGQLTFMDRATTGDNADDWAINVNVPSGQFADTWKLLTLTYDMSGGGYAYAKIYLDGVAIGNSGSYTKLTNSLKKLIGGSSTTGYFGRTQWNNAENPDFVGSMDEIRIYNRVITDEEIMTLYENTRPTVTAPVTLKYEDTEGNKIAEDVVVSADAGVEYEVPAIYKSLPSSSDDQYRYIYTYSSSRSDDVIVVSTTDENVCKLVFEYEKRIKTGNLLDNPSFEENVDGWTSNAGGTLAPITGWVRSSDQAHKGDYSLKRVADVGSGSAENFGTYIPIESGKVYYFRFWEYCANDVPVGKSMMSAVCVATNKSATNAAANHLVQYGGYSSWVNDDGRDDRDVAYTKGWSMREFVFDTTGATNANYIFVAYAWSAGGADFYVDDFYLKEGAEPPVEEDEEDPDEPIDGNTVPVIVKYVDVDGNKIAEDAIVQINPNKTPKYTVEDYLIDIDDLVDGSIRYKYTYVENRSQASVDVSELQENICKLVYTVTKTYAQNLVTDGSFEDENGNFSWGTWQSPRGDGFFNDIHSDYFYKVNRESGGSVLDKAEITADDYALGTRWNDPTTGLCSMANFIPVQAGKTYLVSYDYKHKEAGTDAKYISTSFQTQKDFALGATGQNIPKNVSTEWQTNTFQMTPNEDGYIYFHFSYVGSGGGVNPGSNAGSGPYWYFDNFEVYEMITFENKITYEAGQASIIAKDGTTGYLIQATYNEEGALEEIAISEKLTLFQEAPVLVPVTEGAKLMLVKDLTSLEPLAEAVIAE